MSRPEAVLIVDEDDLYVRSLSVQLRALGFPFVYRAASAKQAIAMLERVHPTLVLTGELIEHQEAGVEVVSRAKHMGASVAVVSNPLDVHVEAMTLESLIFSLIGEAQQRSRSSIPVSEKVA